MDFIVFTFSHVFSKWISNGGFAPISQKRYKIVWKAKTNLTITWTTETHLNSCVFLVVVSSSAFSTNNKQQTTNNEQQTTNNKQQTTNNKQQTTDNKQQTTNNKQQTTPTGTTTAGPATGTARATEPKTAQQQQQQQQQQQE